MDMNLKYCQSCHSNLLTWLIFNVLIVLKIVSVLILYGECHQKLLWRRECMPKDSFEGIPLGLVNLPISYSELEKLENYRNIVEDTPVDQDSNISRRENSRNNRRRFSN
ncbi:hypothetical protein Zmor_015376 [Zophobas morio]|uniref:Uncharacterized protein n=1 Tax=Zophobas morio TaxID=2755281 RepID=A0AA38MHP1_9CUCU|nr:hypothetical protein Zmor_015376 [Zophobas morio]